MNLYMTPQQIGEALEQTLALLHTRYRADRLANVWHSGTRARKAGDEWVPLPSRPDWGGEMWPTGRAIVFDSKSCLDDTYRHDIKRRAHQLIDIWDAYQAGAVAGILVANIGADAAWWLTPTSEWGDGQFVPRKLERATTIPAHKDFPDNYVPDWLAVAA